MEGLNVKELALRLLTMHGRLSSGELARDAGVSHQTAHAVLTGSVGAGLVEAVGAALDWFRVLAQFLLPGKNVKPSM